MVCRLAPAFLCYVADQEMDSSSFLIDGLVEAAPLDSGFGVPGEESRTHALTPVPGLPVKRSRLRVPDL